jgi:hypothetical protein
MATATVTPSTSEIRTPTVLGEYLTREELATELRINVRTLARWEVLRIGPPRTKVGSRTLYKRGSVVAWLAAQELKSARPQGSRSIRRKVR